MLFKFIVLFCLLFSEDKDLYLVYNPQTELYKIGMSNNPERRLKEIQYDLDAELQLIVIFPEMGYMENRLHKIFASQREIQEINGVRSREWFCLNPDDVYFITHLVMEQRNISLERRCGVH